MNCQFCQQQCQAITKDWHHCKTCSTDYHAHAVCLYTNLNDKPYTVTLYKIGPIKMIVSSAYQDPIMELTHAADITPQNIQNKLKTLLTFS
jgi:predicted amidophosphoribosyltransferase